MYFYIVKYTVHTVALYALLVGYILATTFGNQQVSFVSQGNPKVSKP